MDFGRAKANDWIRLQARDCVRDKLRMKLFNCVAVVGRIQVAVRVQVRGDNGKKFRPKSVLFSPRTAVKVGNPKRRVVRTKARGEKLRTEKRQVLAHRED